MTDNLIYTTADAIADNSRLMNFPANHNRHSIGRTTSISDKLQSTEWSADRLTLLIHKTEAAVPLESVCSVDHRCVRTVSVLVWPISKTYLTFSATNERGP